MSSLKFEQALWFTLRWEGGYVDDPDDRGGETKYGISKHSFPDLHIRSLTIEDAAQIYQKGYWAPVHGDDLPAPLGMALFDFAVNSGVSRSTRVLQRLIGAKPDGDFGPGTLFAARTNLASLSRASGVELAREVNSQRMEMISRLVSGSPSQAKFLNGWTRRIMELDRFVGIL